MAAYKVSMVKLVSGEIVLGKYDAEKDVLTDVVTLQNVPTQQGMQMLLAPYGFPFENTYDAVLEGRFIMYRFKETAKELEDKYIEVTTNLSVSSHLGKIQFGAQGAQGGAAGSGLIS